MSHTTRIRNIQVTSMDAAKAAVDALNRTYQGTPLTFTENGSVRLWGHSKQCAFVIGVPDCRFDLGFEAQEDGTFTPILDTHGGWLRNHIGGGMDIAETPEEKQLTHIGGFMREYSRAAVLGVAAAEGAMVEESEVDGGYILQVA